MIDDYYVLTQEHLNQIPQTGYVRKYSLICKYCSSMKGVSICRVEGEGLDHIPVCLRCIIRNKKSRDLFIEKYSNLYLLDLFWRKEDKVFKVYEVEVSGNKYLKGVFDNLDNTISFIIEKGRINEETN